MSDNSPQGLLNSSACFLCYGLSLAEAMEIQLLVNALIARSAIPCTTPGPVSAFHVVTTSSTDITFALAFPIPQPTVGSIIRWGTTLGGPYPNTKSFALGATLKVGTADGLVAGTTYYFVAFATNGTGCVSAASAETSSSLQNSLTGDWLARISAAGGAAPSAATITTMNQFGNSLMAAGLHSLMVYLVVYVPDNLIAAITPYIKTSGNDSCVNHNFVLADLTVNGLIGNGSTKFLDTGCIPLACFPSDATCGNGCYIANIPVAESKTDGGVQGNFPNGQFEINANFNGVAGFDCWDFAHTAVGNLPSNTTGGYVYGSLIAGTITLFFANSGNAHATIGTAAPGGTRPGGSSYYLFCTNSAGVAAVFSSKRLSANFVTLTLTAAQSSTFFTALDTCRRSLGGGFV